MKTFFSSATNPVLQWLVFLGVMLLLCVALGGLIIWLRTARAGKPHRKRRHRRHRHSNPTLAQAGGLPPKRDPNQPPPGP
jgi:uncharacterized iron-regulated membrane protein